MPNPPIPAAGGAMTRGQKKFLEAIFELAHVVVHIRVAQPCFDAGWIFPRFGNTSFWRVGCNSHLATDFYLTREGYDALTGQLSLALAA